MIGDNKFKYKSYPLAKQTKNEEYELELGVTCIYELANLILKQNDFFFFSFKFKAWLSFC